MTAVKTAQGLQDDLSVPNPFKYTNAQATASST